MIKATGKYLLSKDGGNTWLKQKNMILEGYYALARSPRVSLAVGTSSDPVQFDQTSISNKIVSTPSSSVFDGGKSYKINPDNYAIRRTKRFDFGLGNSLELGEMGLYSSGKLASRSIIKDAQGSAIVVSIGSTDSLTILYEITYKIPREPRRISIDFKGQEVGGTMYFANPNKWGSNYFSEVVNITNVGVGKGIALDSEGFVSEGLTEKSMDVDSDRISVDGVLTDSFGIFAGLEDLNGSIEQFVFCSGSVSKNNIVILIDLDAPIEKTNDDSLSLSVLLSQEPTFNGSNTIEHDNGYS